MPRSFWVETLGCAKNQVDSDKLTGTLVADGLVAAPAPTDADLVVVNTCAFVEEARAESLDTVLALAGARRPGSEVVVTGCLAERYGEELAFALPEVDAVVGFGVPVHLGRRGGGRGGRRGGGRAVPSFDLLELPRPPAAAPWAYVKVAEGCDRACGFCAIPSFRGPQRSRSVESILREVEALGAGVREIVLVAQDLAAYGRDQGRGDRRIVRLVEAVAERVERVRLLYLYPSDLTDGLVEAICATGVPYFDLSLQHVSRPLLRAMRRWGDGERFLARMDDIRRRQPEAAFRSNFIVGYPGETEDDHDALLDFLEAARLDWCGFFAWSPEEGTHAAALDRRVAPALVAERLGECRLRQDAITAEGRDALVGLDVEVLVDRPGVGRTYREAPEIDGIVQVPETLAVGELATVRVGGALGPDLVADADVLVAGGGPTPAHG
ncbi:MAG: 30S ribosomal protein S12 methylthiotransferase RimO [Actinomycetota bacterium]|nr:30S ribosomal protein S12 methylthiotransferase RimO [Actinomycetota bacterium]